MTTFLWLAGTALALVLVLALVAAARRRDDVRPTMDIWTALDEELERARRYDHPVALIRLSTREADGVDPERAAGLPTRLRASDHLAISSHDAVVVAPETDTAGATCLAGRLCAHLGGPACDTRIACFPHDALTRHALVQSVNRSRSRHATRRPRRIEERRAM